MIKPLWTNVKDCISEKNKKCPLIQRCIGLSIFLIKEKLNSLTFLFGMESNVKSC